MGHDAAQKEEMCQKLQVLEGPGRVTYQVECRQRDKVMGGSV